MAMAGLGRVHEIWRWPFHYYMAVRLEYLRIISGPEAKSGAETVEIAPGVYRTTTERRD